MAGQHRLLLIALIALLVLSTSRVFGRRLIDNAQAEESSVQFEEIDAKSRMLIEVMDYSGPKANTNPVTGALLSPPPTEN